MSNATNTKHHPMPIRIRGKTRWVLARLAGANFETRFVSTPGVQGLWDTSVPALVRAGASTWATRSGAMRALARSPAL